jgi:hypothetical protein
MRQLHEYVACRPFGIFCNTLPARCCRFSCSRLSSVYVVLDTVQEAREIHCMYIVLCIMQ